MLIFWEQRLVFLATPKAGSTAIEAALAPLAAITFERPPVMKHTPAYRYHRFIAPYLERSSGGARFTTFALMREPLDWLRSWYRFRQREDVEGTDRSTVGMSFDAFLDAYMQKPRPAVADIGAQSRFLSDKSGGVGVDHLFRYESLDSFLGFLEERLDCEVVLPRVNVSPDVAVEIGPEAEARLRAFATADFTLYESLPSHRD